LKLLRRELFENSLPNAAKSELVNHGSVRDELIVREFLVDLVGIEPTTSSMPWNCQKRKLLTVKWLEDGITGKTGQIAPL